MSRLLRGGTIDDKAVLGLELIATLNENPINDNYNIEVGTNVDRKQGLRTPGQNLNTVDTMGTLLRAVSVIKGWVNYHNISDNYKRVHSFVHFAREIIFKWFNRKGGQRKMTWNKCNSILAAIGLSKHGMVKTMFC